MRKTCKSTADAHHKVCLKIDRLRFKRDALTYEEFYLWGELIVERDTLQGQLNRMDCSREEDK